MIFIKQIKALIGVREEAELSPLRGKELGEMGVIEQAWLLLDGDRIVDFGQMDELGNAQEGWAQLEAIESQADQIIDATGRMVFPAWCDSHTHLVYAGSREREFMDKIRGLSYQEIARRGGGILNSVALLHDTSEDELVRQAKERAEEIIRFGTGAVEIKSGYGLSLEDEVKMLRVARRIGEETPLTVRTTFLGAHAVPMRYRDDRAAYVDEIINEMIPVIATEGLAEYIDAFCEEGFFSVEDTDRIFNAGLKYGLIPKVHANQMSFSGGVQLGVKYGARSVDHLEFTGPEEYRLLAESETIATLLPGATFFLEMDFPDARAMIQAGAAVALATNYNPGSCPCGDMRFMTSLACLKLKLTPEEAIQAATFNGACAMDVVQELGSITSGKRANIFITKPMSSYEFLPYAFTTPLVDTVILNGKIYE